MRTRRWLLLAFLLTVLTAGSASAAAVPPQADSIASADERAQIFSHIELGIAQGNPAAFSDHFAPQVYLSIPGEQGAYYSASQAFYLLEQFFRRNRLPDFRFTTMQDGPGTPFASGVVSGARGRAQVYVSLSRAGDGWVIGKMSIY